MIRANKERIKKQAMQALPDYITKPERAQPNWSDKLSAIGGALMDYDGTFGAGNMDRALSRTQQKLRLQDQEKQAELDRKRHEAIVGNMQLTPQQRALMQLNPQGATDAMTKQAFSGPQGPEYGFMNVDGRLIRTNKTDGGFTELTEKGGPERPWWAQGTEVDPAYLAAQKARGTKVTVNAGDEVDPRPITDKPSKDFQRVYDEEAGTYRDEVIPGSSTARERELLNSKAFQSVQANQEQFDAIMTNIDAADELIGPFTAGFGSHLQAIRGTPAKDLEARLETVKANIGFDKLNEMRQTSPTGGALGQVTERELKFLQSVRGSIDEQQSPAQLRQTLGEIKESLQRLAEVREIAFKLEQQNPGEGQIVATDPLQSSDLPEGFALQGEDADLLEYMTPEERALFQGGAQ